MFIATILAVLSNAVTVAPPTPGKAIYETAAAAQCTSFYPPGEPKNAKDPLNSLEKREPYRGEDMLKPIDANGQVIQARVMRFPPGFPIDTAPKGFRAVAKGEVQVSPAGDVIRVELTSPNDARFSVYAASQIAYWRYKAVPNGSLCRKIPVEFEWRID